MNLQVQVEPLRAALQASSPRRHAHHAASRLTWKKKHRLKRRSEPSRTKQDAEIDTTPQSAAVH